MLTRGDRRIGAALEEAWRRGARLDGWRECFQPKLWWQTFADLGIDTAFYSQRNRPLTELLPWDHVNGGAARDALASERDRARATSTGQVGAFPSGSDPDAPAGGA